MYPGGGRPWGGGTGDEGSKGRGSGTLGFRKKGVPVREGSEKERSRSGTRNRIGGTGTTRKTGRFHQIKIPGTRAMENPGGE